MATKPRLLDLCCGAGGASKGYQRAGFYVIGVDINPQPRYCGDEFIQMDALEYLRFYGGRDSIGGQLFAAIHASFPCQRWSSITKRNGTQEEHPYWSHELTERGLELSRA